MVERLKVAIEKARARRDGPVSPARPAAPPSPAPQAAGAPAEAESWSRLPELPLDAAHLTRERIVTHRKGDPASVAFDLLRTRLLKACADNGWFRIGVTSPTKACGKTLVTSNLAFSLGRHPTARTALLDLDLRAPRLSARLGAKGDRRIRDFLTGETAPEAFLARSGETLAFALNDQAETHSAELVQSAQASAAISGLIRELRPTMMVYDLPPLLAGDDALASLGLVDCVLLVAAAGQTQPHEIEECERLIAGDRPLLGVALNKVAESGEGYYAYES
jgi:Mrp family chromosome partitioning ATPase